MNWSKAKNWLIILFIGVNLFLVYTIFRTNIQSSVIDKETIANTVNILNANGITVTADTIPNKVPNLSPIDVVNNITDYDALAALILGEGAVKAEEEPDYTAGSRHLWFAGDIVSYTDSNPQEPIAPFSEKTAQDFAIEQLRSYGFDMERAQVSAAMQPDGAYLVTVTHKIDQYALFDSYFSVSVSQNGISSFTGSWFTVSGGQNMLANDTARVKPVVSVLLDFIRDTARIEKGSTEIERIDLGYMTKEKDTYHKNATAMPVWLIRCTDGNTYDYEAR